MPETYTITAGDVSGVDSSSLLTAGVVFNWTDQTITVPASVNGITGQWMVDNGRFAEDTVLGIARPKIVNATGNVQIGTDPSTSQPIVTGVLGILLDAWQIITLKGTGEEFTIQDIYKTDASLPYDNTVAADVIYRQTINPTVVFVSVEGSTFTLEDIWTYATRTLTGPVSVSGYESGQSPVELLETDNTKLDEIWRFKNLDAAKPITGDDSDENNRTVTDGTVTITHTRSGDQVTATRTG